MKIILLLLFILLASQSYGQGIVWEKKFTGGKVHTIINKTADSSFIVSGASNVTPNYPAHVAKFDWDGNVIWQKTGKILVTGEQDIQQTSDGGYLFSGVKSNFSSPNVGDIIIQKLSPTGDTVWHNVYSTPLGFDYTHRLFTTSNNNIINLGTTEDNTFYYYSLRRTDSLGNTLWFKSYAKGLNNYASNMVLNRHGNLVLAGSSSIGSAGIPYYHPYLIEVNLNGDSIRSKKIIVKSDSYSEFIARFFNNIVQTADGGYAFSGYLDSASYRVGFIVKTDSILEKQWAYFHQPEFPDNQYVSRIAQMQDSTYLLLSSVEENFGNKIIITRISKTGQLINKQVLNATWCSKIRLYDWEFLPDSSVVVVGGCFDNPNQGYMAKIGGVGIPAVVAPIDTGTVGIVEVPLLQQQATLGLSYPNPAKTEATIPFTLPKGISNATVEIHDLVKGAKLQEFKLFVKEGKGAVTADPQNLSSGVYLYSLIVDGKPVSTKKMVVIK